MNQKMSGFSSVSNDVLQNILSRLPAKSFASAACVNKCWNCVCGRTLSKPMLASALSLNPSVHLAVREVLDKVLSKPIRPHFAIAFVGLQFCLRMTHRLITDNLGPNTPVITSAATGIIGMDAFTEQLKEVKWDFVCPDDLLHGGCHSINNLNRGIVLIVGFIPGLKVDIIPLIRPKMNQEPRAASVNKFIMDVQNFTASVSGVSNPVGIILFGDHRIDMKPVVAEINYAMPEETVVVGDASSCFLWRSSQNSSSFNPNLHFLDAIGLVFARDIQNHIGDIKFHVTISTGIIPFGPHLQVVSVEEKEGEFSLLTVRVKGELDILDGHGILEATGDVISDEFHSLFIGVTKQRGLENGGLAKYLAFHEVLGAEQEVFIVSGTGISPGDSFLFYHSDSDTARSSCIESYSNLNNLKAHLSDQNTHIDPTRTSSSSNAMIGPAELFGGIVFACSSRGEQFFGRPNMDCMPFLENFPGMPVGGAFCLGEIGRAAVLEEEDEEDDVSCSMQVYSTVYLAMSYLPARVEYI